MDDGVQLSLNIESLPSGEHTFGSKKKIQGDRRSRVKQRKKLRLEKEREQQSVHDPKEGEHSGKKRKLPASDDQGQGLVKHKKTDGVISSLFRKNPEVPEIKSAEVESLKENVFTGRTFGDLPIHPYLVSALQDKLGFREMTEVQKRAIPVLLRHRDALVKSQTGSGKTLAYAVPIIQSLQSRPIKVRRDDGPYALVIVPTRELALQSYDTFVKLLRTFVWIVPGCLMGGEKRKAEKSRLRKGVNILVATPGRLMDHIQSTSVLSLRRIQWLVIDEADRLLELGYERDVAQIVNAVNNQCPDPPQTVLLSATLSEGVNRLSGITMKDPDHIDVGAKAVHPAGGASVVPPDSGSVSDPERSEDTFTVPSQLRQYFIVTPCKLRLVTLAAFILWKCKYEKPGHKMVVFLSTQDSVEFHHRLLSRVLGPSGDGRDTAQRLQDLAYGGGEEEEEDVGDSDENDEDRGEGVSNKKKALKIFQLYGDMDQKARTKTFEEFSLAKSGVLLCTDVAARGLDLPNVNWIVQYTSPGSTVDYIHRVGRTARAGTGGQALLFLMPSESGYVQELNKHKISMAQLQSSSIFKQLLTHIDDLPAAQTENSSRQKPRTQEEAATYLQDRFEECVLRNKMIHGLAGKGFQSYVRAYATYSKEAKVHFQVSSLHLGHVAKSFALREAPTRVHGVAATSFRKQHQHRDQPARKRPLSFKQATLSEYSSGLDTTTSSSTTTSSKGKRHGKAKVKARNKGKGR